MTNDTQTVPKVEGLDTPEQAVAALTKVIVGRESFIYQEPSDNAGCVYVFQGKPSCLVGQVLVQQGVPVEWLETYDRTEHMKLAFSLCNKLGLPEAVGAVLQSAQSFQDTGHTWGEALSRASAAAAESS